MLTGVCALTSTEEVTFPSPFQGVLKYTKAMRGGGVWPSPLAIDLVIENRSGSNMDK